MHIVSNILFDFIQLGSFIFPIIAAVLIGLELGLKPKNQRHKNLLLIIALVCCVIATLAAIASTRTYTM